MSLGWTLYISVLVLGNIAAAWWLIRWTGRPRPGEPAPTQTTGHVWDGDLTEYNKPMPRWWLYLFYISMLFGLAYLLFYPGLGTFPGLLQWNQTRAYNREMDEAEEKYAPLFARYAKTDILALARNPQAMDTARRLFANNCAGCHGSDAHGGPGFPNLTDQIWLHGGDPQSIEQTIANGRNGAMPSWGNALGDQGVVEVANYVYSLNGRRAPDPAAADRGRQKFASYCAGCHGADGKGNQALGAPNLTDHDWLYGGSLATIEETIRNGRNGHMPAHRERLGADKVHLLAAYVYSLSHNQDGNHAP